MTLSRRRQAQQEAIRRAMTEPIPCECGRCGNPATILPTANGGGICICPVCSLSPKQLRRWREMQKGTPVSTAEYRIQRMYEAAKDKPGAAPGVHIRDCTWEELPESVREWCRQAYQAAFQDGVAAAESEEREYWIQDYAEKVLVSWCANPQMFAEGAHVPYSSLLVNARELASLAWVMKQHPCGSSAELRTETELAGFAVAEGMFPETKGGLRDGH